MKVIILADGNGTRWGMYKGVEKQLLKIDGETLLDRMIRLCKENGMPKKDIIILGKFQNDNAINDSFPNCPLKRQLFLEIAKKYNEPFILLMVIVIILMQLSKIALIVIFLVGDIGAD